MRPQDMMGEKLLSRLLLLYKKRLQFIRSLMLSLNSSIMTTEFTSMLSVFHFFDPCFGLQVQHDHLVDTSVMDIATVDLVVNALHYIFPTFDYK